MSLLREVVDEANKLRTQRITLKEGKRPSFFTAKGTVESKKFNPLTTADIDNFFSSIFAQAGNLLRHQRHTRKFKVLDLGELDCIGLTDLRQINIYFASGAALYALDHAQFFPKSATEEDGARQADGQGDDSDSNNGSSMIDAMISLSDLPSANQNSATENTTSPSNSASPPAAQSSTPDNADGNALQIDLTAVNDNSATVPLPDTSTQADTESAEKIGTSVFEIPTKTEENSLNSLPSKQDNTVAPLTDASNVIELQGDDKRVQEETGVHTTMNKVAKQLDQVVAENTITADDSNTQFAAVPTPQEVALKQTPAVNTLTGVNAVSDGSNAIDKLLQEMMAKKASDLHLSCDRPVMMRIGGEMEKVNANDKITSEALQNWLNPIIPAADVAKLEQSGDVDFTYELRGVGRFRVNVLKDLHGIGAVLRYVPASLKTLEELDAPDIVKKFCYLSKGLVIINGPAGSGRSTTMAAMIDVINTSRKAHLLSIEDPIEFVHAQKNSLIRQREVGTHTNSMQEGLRAALREDPDIICTGELREAAAMLMAMKCAEAGRLVFSMMHTRNSVLAIDSIINQFPPAHQGQVRHLLANTLRGVISQTLVRKKSGSLVSAWEVLIVSDEAAAMIKTGRTQQITSHMIAHRVKGNILLNDSLLKLVDEGAVSFNNALIAAADKRALHALAHRRGMKLSA